LTPTFSGVVFGVFGLLFIATILWHRYYAQPLIPRFFVGSRAVSAACKSGATAHDVQAAHDVQVDSVASVLSDRNEYPRPIFHVLLSGSASVYFAHFSSSGASFISI